MLSGYLASAAQADALARSLPEGVFYAWGAGIQRGMQVGPLQIYDLVPTVLHALSISADEPFDGRVAQEIFMQSQLNQERSGESVVDSKLKRLRASRAVLSQ